MYKLKVSSYCLSGTGNAIIVFFLYKLQNLINIDVEHCLLQPTGCFWIAYACIMNSSLRSVQHCTLCSGTQEFSCDGIVLYSFHML